jgi:hypothetical protein
MKSPGCAILLFSRISPSKGEFPGAIFGPAGIIMSSCGSDLLTLQLLVS